MSNIVNQPVNNYQSELAIFEMMQRKSKAYASSTMVPEHFKGNFANCLIALEMAHRLKMSPFMVMQNMYIVYGKPAWSSAFIIACVNASGRFTPIQFEYSGEKDQRQCIAFATDKASGKILKSTPVSIMMAKSEGWSTKKGSKWHTMPDLMLQYRAASFFARAYAPDYLLGLHAQDEIVDSYVEQDAQVINLNKEDNKDDVNYQDNLESILQQGN